jgi:hypothetical protein
MTEASIVWLASYPRSGNTFLRTILWQCLGLRSASIYPTDLGGKKALEEYVGHIEHDAKGQIAFPKDSLPRVKTHEPPRDNSPAIYVIRDGRDACVSLWKFYDKTLPLDAVVRGQHRFGTWAGHIQSWNPVNRPNTLLLKYEDMIADLAGTLGHLSAFLKRDVVSTSLPSRDTIAGSDGRWVRSKEDSRKVLTSEILALFEQVNGETSRLFGYTD